MQIRLFTPLAFVTCNLPGQEIGSSGTSNCEELKRRVVVQTSSGRSLEAEGYSARQGQWQMYVRRIAPSRPGSCCLRKEPKGRDRGICLAVHQNSRNRKYTEARPALERAWAITEAAGDAARMDRTYCWNDPIVLRSILNNYAVVLRATHRRREARSIEQQAAGHCRLLPRQRISEYYGTIA